MSRAVQFSVRGPGRPALRVRGVAMLSAIALVCAAVWQTLQPDRDGQVDFDIVASSLGDGVGTDTLVRLRGMTVGSVVDIQPLGTERQRVRLSVDAPRLAELSTAMQTRFVSANIFGSTALELLPMPGGDRLVPGGELDLGDRVDNFTVTKVLRDSGRAVTDIVTARLSTSIENAANLTEAGAPLIASALLLARTWQRTQQIPLAELLRKSADMSEGFAAFTPSALGILTALASVKELDDSSRTQQASDTISEVSNLVFAFAGQLVGALGPTSQAMDMVLDMVIPLNQAMRGVTPQQVHDLVTGVDGALRKHDDKVALDVELLIGSMPAFRVPTQAAIGGAR